MPKSKYNSYQNQKDAHNAIADYYENKMSNTLVGSLNTTMKDTVISFTSSNFKPNTKILDIGCGDGRLLREITQLNSNMVCVGFDASDRFIELANLKKIKNQKYFVADAMNFKIKDTFDLVYVIAVLHRLADPDVFLQRLKTISKKNTTYVVTTMNNLSPQFILLKFVVLFCEFISRPVGDHVGKIGFNFREIKELINKNGYEIEKLVTIGFTENLLGLKVSSKFTQVLKYLDTVISKIPIINKLGVFTVVVFKR